MSEEQEVEAIRRLFTLAEKYGLAELEVEQDGLRIRLRAAGSTPEEIAAGPEQYLWRPPQWTLPSGEPAETPEQSRIPETAVPLTAPVYGTFYRSSSPETPVFVEVGDTVEEGQTVGLIEAMKVFSEVVADRAGVVVEISAQNGKIVQHGDVLMYINPL